MFKTDETVRFGQILSARTLRYGKFNEYIIIIMKGPKQKGAKLCNSNYLDFFSVQSRDFHNCFNIFTMHQKPLNFVQYLGQIK